MRRARLAAVFAAGVLLLTGCGAFDSDKTPNWVKDGTRSLDLSVTGQPTSGALAAFERVMARVKDRDADGLAELAEDGDGTKEDAQRLVDKWGDAAQKPMTADFTSPDKTLGVEVTFKGVREKLGFTFRWLYDKDEEKYGVILNPDG